MEFSARRRGIAPHNLAVTGFNRVNNWPEVASFFEAVKD